MKRIATIDAIFEMQEHVMKNKLRPIRNFRSGFYILMILSLIYPVQGITGEFDAYRYKLEENNNDKVCTHMAGVFSKYFKKPFATINDEAEYVKDGGVLPALLPGARDDLRSFIDMRFSFQPTSPEFDAIKWRVGKIKRPTHGERMVPNFPFIAADLDINNDGQMETVIKFEFMTCYNFYSAGCSPSDSLSIFRKGDIDLMQGPVKLDVFYNGQNGHPPLAVIYGRSSECKVVRPFIYDGVTYFSCYFQNWGINGPDINRLTPDKEYTDILKYQGFKKLSSGRKSIKAETICRFSMTVAK